MWMRPLARRLQTRGCMNAEWTILVVEDHEDSSIPLCAILEAEGYRCRVARSGREALSLARRVRPRVILLDLGLPDVSGIEVFRILRDEETLGDCRVLAITGQTDEATRDRCRTVGVNAFFPKPVDPERVLETIRLVEDS